MVPEDYVVEKCDNWSDIRRIPTPYGLNKKVSRITS